MEKSAAYWQRAESIPTHYDNPAVKEAREAARDSLEASFQKALAKGELVAVDNGVLVQYEQYRGPFVERVDVDPVTGKITQVCSELRSGKRVIICGEKSVQEMSVA